MTDETKSRRPLNEIHDLREQLIRASDAYLAYEYGFIKEINPQLNVDNKQEARKLVHYSLIRYFRRIRPHLQKRDKLWSETELWGKEQGLQVLDDWVLKHTTKTVKTQDGNLKGRDASINGVDILDSDKMIDAVDKLLEATEELGFDVAADKELPVDHI